MMELLLALTLLASPLSIESTITTSQSGWIGYSVPIANPNARLCCWDCSTAGCSLEGADGFSVNRDLQTASDRKLVVFFRIENRRVEKIRLFSSDCTVDTTGANVRWLGEAETDESVSYLLKLVASDRSDRVGKQAISALAFHAGDRAIRELISIARSDSSSKHRSNALFWLAQSAGRKAAGTLTDAVDHDPDTDVKTKAVFAISQLPPDDSIPILIRLVKTHKNPAVRKKAMFWLGQTNDPRAVQLIEDILLR